MVGKDKGKQGNVIAYVKELNAVFVSGLNLVKKPHIFLYFHIQTVLFLRKFNESVVVLLLLVQLLLKKNH